MGRLLILGGTRDSVDLASAAAALDGIDVVYSLAGVTANPNLPECEVRRGGFGGPGGLLEYIVAHAFDAVIDATHPFAVEIAANAHAACRDAGVPRLKFLRPPWRPAAGDDWIEAASVVDTVSYLRDHPGTVLLTIGAREISAFFGLDDCRFVVRYIHAPKVGVHLKNCAFVVDRGPFDEAGETQLMRAHNIEYVVSKNSGGGGGAAKLAAARALQIPVIMINRPDPPPGARAETQTDVLGWLEKI